MDDFAIALANNLVDNFYRMNEKVQLIKIKVNVSAVSDNSIVEVKFLI